MKEGEVGMDFLMKVQMMMLNDWLLNSNGNLEKVMVDNFWNCDITYINLGISRSSRNFESDADSLYESSYAGMKNNLS